MCRHVIAGAAPTESPSLQVLAPAAARTADHLGSLGIIRTLRQRAGALLGHSLGAERDRASLRLPILPSASNRPRGARGGMR